MKQNHFEEYLSTRFELKNIQMKDEEIWSADLISRSDPSQKILIVNGIPRFVSSDNYAQSFGLQWNRFKSTQLDSASGQPLTFNRFWNNTKWKPRELFGKKILEVGSGAGRFTEILLEAGARVTSFDFSNAVEANFQNNKEKGDLFLFQASVYEIPLDLKQFDFIFCYGVLQHTPDPNKSFDILYSGARDGCKISIDYYPKYSWPTCWTTPKYFWRPIAKKIAPEKLLRFIQFYIPLWLPFDTLIRKIPYFGPKILAYVMIPCWNYTHMPLTRRQRKEWAILDTFDALSAAFDYPKTGDEVLQMVLRTGQENVEVFSGSNGYVANLTKGK
ncbi:MAG: class I SAM-dependent methyltransferase [Deltaproteobacteria bacterium]|nr:class I SAM-dependent methyltransferase [Deltaproteobacteria bacterium]